MYSAATLQISFFLQREVNFDKLFKFWIKPQ